MKRILLILATAFCLACLVSAAPSPEEAARKALVPQPNEKVILQALRAIVLLPGAAPGELAKTASPGLHLERVPILDNDVTRQALKIFLDQPVSIQSLHRLELVIRLLVRQQGRPFALIYTPPQDITAGTIHVVVQLAVLQGGVRVDGNTWFASDTYLAALHARAGEPLDSRTLMSDLAWLNRNPFRHVTPEISPGKAPGTTTVTLQAQEAFPLSVTTGFDNTGTATTGEDRVSASAEWGDAFGRGDLLDVGASGDPDWRYMKSFSAGYTAYLPWRHILSFQAELAKISSDLPEPFAQSGKTWELDARYEVPLKNPRPGWTQDLAFIADFKYSDNTLLFSSTPITGNATDIVEGGVNYALTLPGLGGRNALNLTAVGSPGGLAGRNHDQDFEGSRAGAKAEYAYVRLNLSHQHPLPGGFSLSLSATAQLASGALLGSEQLVGTGAAAVRGYPESSAFGDDGVVVNSELHLPPVNLARGRVAADFFTFADAASLNLRVQDQSTDLRSVGLGANLICYRRLSVRFAYGWQLKYLDDSTDRGRGHIAVNLNW